MAERFSNTSVNLDVMAGDGPAHERPDADTPFQMLIIGDFTGRANRGLHAPLAGRRPRRVDCDNLDDTMAELAVTLNLPGMSLRIRGLDDFHPDHIYCNAAPFRELEESRDRPPR